MYSEKIASVKQIIEIHNQNAEEKKKINFETFLNCLQVLGGTTEEALSLCTWEDLEGCGLPRLIARQVSQSIFRKAEATQHSNVGVVYVTDKKAYCMTTKQLLEAYNPFDSKNAVGKRLNELSNGKRCIVFTEDGKVNVEASEKLVDEIKQGYPELDITQVGGIPFQIYRVGDMPDLYADENPIYPGRPLRSGGFCDQTGRSWEGISDTIRQLLHIAVTTKELDITMLDMAHTAMDKAVSNDAEKIVRSRYPKASLKFDELKKIGKLPVLKVKMGTLKSSDSRVNNPFNLGQNKTY
jgi:hypothetical protein